MMVPKKERIAAWVKALRSGEYMQAVGALAKTEEDGVVSYCCLGVACVLYNEHFKTHPITLLDEESSLPDEVAEWYGIDRDPQLYADTATVWNDGRMANFDKIASLLMDTFLQGEDDG